MLRKCLLLSALPILLFGNQAVLAETPAHSTPKIVLVILENKNATSALDQKNLPFLWRLAHEGASLSNYHAITHPSQPNYVALISGSTEGVSSDRTIRLHRAHLGQRVASWAAYAEDYPDGTCDLRPRIGHYVRKHVPFLSFADIQGDEQACRHHITGVDAFTSTALAQHLPAFSLVIPNLDHDAHNGSLVVADAWLGQHFSALLDDANFRRDVILIVTFDEDEEPWPYLRHGENRIYAALWGDHVIPGAIATRYDHYDLLRTIESVLSVAPMAAGDKNAKVIIEALR